MIKNRSYLWNERQNSCPHGHYFCSEECIRKYEKEHDIKEEEKYCPNRSLDTGKPWYKEKLFIISFITTILLIYNNIP